MNRRCPKCGSFRVVTERRIYGDSCCELCDFKAPTARFDMPDSKEPRGERDEPCTCERPTPTLSGRCLNCYLSTPSKDRSREKRICRTCWKKFEGEDPCPYCNPSPSSDQDAGETIERMAKEMSYQKSEIESLKEQLESEKDANRKLIGVINKFGHIQLAISLTQRVEKLRDALEAMASDTFRIRTRDCVYEMHIPEAREALKSDDEMEKAK